MTRRRPSFLESWLDDTKDIVSSRGAWAIVPWSFLVALGVGVACGIFMPTAFFSVRNWGVSATFYGGVLAFNALTLALAWNAFGGVFERIARTEFANFLRESGELEKYLFTISYIHIVQVLASVVTLAGGMLVFMPIEYVQVDRVCLGATTTLTVYALRWAMGAVRVSQDIVWNYAVFDGLSSEEKKRLRLAASNGT